MTADLRFPLFERAQRAGVLDGASALVVAPTATGKSFLGRQVVYRAARERDAVNAYLVPYRALAAEIFDTVRGDVSSDGALRVRLATGDATDPVRPEETDILVATYERFAGLLESQSFPLGAVVADEFHLLDDATRGPVVEGLVARMMATDRHQSFLGLSAVIDEPASLAEWLGVALIEGGGGDRAVRLDRRCEVVRDRDSTLAREATGAVDAGDQVLVFCSSRSAAEKVAQEIASRLGEGVTGARSGGRSRDEMRTDLRADAGMDKLVNAVARGVGYHHAGLSRRARQVVEGGFRDGALRVIAATPTLAAGVNLPAELVIVRDIFRHTILRGRDRRVVLSSGELLNMLGRAGRPNMAERGLGLVFIEKRYDERPDVLAVQDAIRRGKGAPVRSRLLDSFDALLRFVLAVVVEHGETTRSQVIESFRRTLWYHEHAGELEFGRPFEEDMMEDLPAWKRARTARPALVIDEAAPAPDGLEGVVVSGDHRYAFHLGLGEWSCGCQAAQYRPWEVCKHVSFVIHEFLFGEDVDRELHDRAVYTCLHLFTDTLDPGTKLDQAIRLLLDWRLLERVPGGLRAALAGRVASSSRFDVLLVRHAERRVDAASDATSLADVAAWTVEDFFPLARDRERWGPAVQAWVRGAPEREFSLPVRYRGDFERGLEELSHVSALYRDLASDRRGHDAFARLCESARGSLRYGVPPRALALAGLRLPGLGRRRCLVLVDEHGVEDVADLASRTPESLTLTGVSATQVAAWIGIATELVRRRNAALADADEARSKLDELLSEFRVEPQSLFTASS